MGWLQNKVDAAVSSVVLWALSRPAVTQRIVRLASDEVRDFGDNFSVDADDIAGLDRYIDRAMDDIDADDISGLDSYIEQSIDIGFITEKVTEEIVKRLTAQRLTK